MKSDAKFQRVPRHDSEDESGDGSPHSRQTKDDHDIESRPIAPAWTVVRPKRLVERLEDAERQRFGTGILAFVYNTFVAGWHAGLVRALMLSTGALILNVTVYAVFYTRYNTKSGTGTILHGACSTVHRADTGIHGGLNAISTLILGASTYAMEGLMAPTRKEVDRAHAKRSWVEIGVQSLRNMKYISTKRGILWLLLSLTSLPLHLLYVIPRIESTGSLTCCSFNSVFFTTSQANQYSVAIVTENYFNNTGWIPSADTASPRLFKQENSAYQEGDFDRPDNDSVIALLTDARDPIASQNFVTMDPWTCISNYAVGFPQSYSDVVLVTSNQSTYPLLWSRYPQRSISFNKTETNQDPFYWICRDIMVAGDGDETRCSSEFADRGYDHGRNWTIYGYPIDRCLARKTPDICELQFNVFIMLGVVVIGVIKTIILIYLIFEKPSGRFLRTLGDAVASFLEFEDPTTRGMCLISSEQIRKKGWRESYGPQLCKDKKLRWWHGASLPQFFSTIGLSWFYTIALTIALGFAIDGANGTAFDNGIGVPDIQSLASFQADDTGSSGIVPTLIIANIPQLGFSILYVAYNNIFCKMAVAQEFDRYSLHRKGLRVSERPRGAQRASHFFSLPNRYALPLLVMSAFLHWMTSRSFFMVRIDGVDRNGVVDPDDKLARLGYSSWGIIALTAVCLCATVATLCLGAFKRLHTGLGESSNSAVISAACHPLVDEEDAHLQEVTWGDVSTYSGDGGVRHCSFTSRLAQRPIVDVLYS